MVSLHNDSAAALRPQAVAESAEGFLFLSADVSQTVWLYNGLLQAD